MQKLAIWFDLYYITVSLIIEYTIINYHMMHIFGYSYVYKYVYSYMHSRRQILQTHCFQVDCSPYL